MMNMINNTVMHTLNWTHSWLEQESCLKQQYLRGLVVLVLDWRFEKGLLAWVLIQGVFQIFGLIVTEIIDVASWRSCQFEYLLNVMRNGFLHLI